MIDQNCMYCVENDHRDSLMIRLCELPASVVYLFREQTYYGRCVVASKSHVKELFELEPQERAAFMDDVARVARAINETVSADKMNYGIYGDKVPHLHVHLVPKREGGRGFGGTFEMMCTPPTHLSEEEYKKLGEQLLAHL